MSETLPVSAIKNGTVIDHISTGQAFRIVQLLSLENTQACVTIGLHLPSKRLGQKDLIKIEGRVLTEQEANEIVIFAPMATINEIKDFKVAKKFITHVPQNIKKVFRCPNPMCITNAEAVENCFAISEERKQVKLTCAYCEKTFDRDQLKVAI